MEHCRWLRHRLLSVSPRTIALTPQAETDALWTNVSITRTRSILPPTCTRQCQEGSVGCLFGEALQGQDSPGGGSQEEM
jgi:hypothetical protein